MKNIPEGIICGVYTGSLANPWRIYPRYVQQLMTYGIDEQRRQAKAAQKRNSWDPTETEIPRGIVAAAAPVCLSFA